MVESTMCVNSNVLLLYAICWYAADRFIVETFLPPEGLAIRSAGFGSGYWSTTDQLLINTGFTATVVPTKSHRPVLFWYRHNRSMPITVGNPLHNPGCFQPVQLILNGVPQTIQYRPRMEIAWLDIWLHCVLIFHGFQMVSKSVPKSWLCFCSNS